MALAQPAPIAIPAGTLDRALLALGHQTGVEVISTEPGLAAVRTRGVAGGRSVRQALRVLLSGTGFRALATRGGGFRVIRDRRPDRPRQRARPSAMPPRETLDPSDIVVTGSKQKVRLLRYPGSVAMLSGNGNPGKAGGGDLTDATAALPILQSTQLGSGRNKVFIRGIADSSFNGATQSTASIYFDDVQLNYSGPDPGLRLYDLRSVEVMEGPQGTLYGAGAIGGVIRVTSNPVDLAAVHGSVESGVTLTRGGAPGFDAAGMLNMPLKSDVIGLRAVAYAMRDGGYIDDRQRARADVNRSDTVGGRLALRIDPSAGWRIEASGAGQQIVARDGQYSERPIGDLAHASPIGQPFDSRVLFGRLVVTHDWSSGLKITSATGIAAVDTRETFDVSAAAPPPATPGPTPTYVSDTSKLLLTEEGRISRALPGGRSWVVGFTLLSNTDILNRAQGAMGEETSIIGVTNLTKAASLFGEATFALRKSISVTVGARATIARIYGEPSATPRANTYVAGRLTRRVDPTIAASWALTHNLALFARYQTGYRTGGLAVARGIGRVADYQADSIMVGEVGIRKLRGGPRGVAFSGSTSIAHWTGIQADLLNRRGQPYTANIGDARIVTVEGNVDWVPMAGLRAAASFLYTQNQITGAFADLSVRNNRRLPETPPLAARGELAYAWRVGPVADAHVGGTINYVGRSVLGPGDLLDISQGNYVSLGASGGVKLRRFDVSLVVDNLADGTANRFAFGNPFAVTTREQRTPQRPLNARLAVSAAF